MYKVRYEKEEYTDDYNPRQWPNLGTMIFWHNRRNLGDNQAKLSDLRQAYANGGEDSVESYLRQTFGIDRDAIILPIYAYEHGGITISHSNLSYPFTDPWDSGQAGIIYCNRDKARDWLGCKRLTQNKIDRVEEILKEEIDEYDLYLTADIWYYCIEDENGDIYDSCGGFFGFDNAKEEAERILEIANAD